MALNAAIQNQSHFSMQVYFFSLFVSERYSFGYSKYYFFNSCKSTSQMSTAIRFMPKMTSIDIAKRF